MWSQTVPLDVCSPRGMVRFAVAIYLAHCAHNLVASCVWESCVATIKHKEPSYTNLHQSTPCTFSISNLYFSKSRNVHTWSVFQNQVTIFVVLAVDLIVCTRSCCMRINWSDIWIVLFLGWHRDDTLCHGPFCVFTLECSILFEALPVIDRGYRPWEL